jgi:general secretion pathway protein A
MYEQVFHFFGLQENPFRVSPDPRFYFSTPASDAALAELIHSVDTPQGFIVLTGEAGTGKTTLLNHFLDWLCDRQRSSSYVFHPQLKPAELFDFILCDFGVPCETGHKGHPLATLHQWLIRRHATGDSPVVIIDEAQAVSVRTLGQLRLLLDLEKPGSKLLHIVLAGQPQLDEKLRRPELRRLQEHVTFHCSLLPLSSEETAQYVKSRLVSAGGPDVGLFTQESLEMTHLYARGIPRTLNLLCEHALISGYTEQVKVISPDMIRRVAADFDLTPQPATADERELSARFGRLVPLCLEEMPSGVAPVTAALESANAETIVVERASFGARQLKSGPLQEVEPALIVEETISLALPRANPVKEAMAAAAPTFHHTLEPIANPAKDLRRVSPKKLPVGWQRTGLSERFVRYWKDVSASFAGGWKQFMDVRAATPVNVRMAAAAPTLRRTLQPIVKLAKYLRGVSPKKLPAGWQRTGLGERFVRFRKYLRTPIAGDWKQFMDVRAATSVNVRMAVAVPTLRRTVRSIAKPATDLRRVSAKRLPVDSQGSRLGERFVPYWKEMSASFVRDWKQFLGANGPPRVVSRKRR